MIVLLCLLALIIIVPIAAVLLYRWWQWRTLEGSD
jgi:hypothetical protein